MLWWAGAYECGDSPLGRLLFARRDDGSVDTRVRRRVEDEEVVRVGVTRLNPFQ